MEKFFQQYKYFAPQGHSIVSETDKGIGYKKKDEQYELDSSEIQHARKVLSEKICIKDNDIAEQTVQNKKPDMLPVLKIRIAPELSEE